MPKKKSLDADQCRGIICSQLLATVGMLDQMADRDVVTEQLEWLFENRELVMVTRARLTPIADELPHLRRQMLTWAKSMTAEACSIADTLIEMSRSILTRV